MKIILAIRTDTMNAKVVTTAAGTLIATGMMFQLRAVSMRLTCHTPRSEGE